MCGDLTSGRVQAREGRKIGSGWMLRWLDRDSGRGERFGEDSLGEYCRGGNRDGGGRWLRAQRHAAANDNGDRAIGVGDRLRDVQVGFGGGGAGDYAADELDVRGLRRGYENGGIAGLGGRRDGEVDHVVVDHDGGHDDIRAAFARTVGEQAGVDENAALDFADAFGGDVGCELFYHGERIAVNGGSVVRVILVDEGQGAVGANAIGEIGVATGNQNEIALELAFFVD